MNFPVDINLLSSTDISPKNTNAALKGKKKTLAPIHMHVRSYSDSSIQCLGVSVVDQTPTEAVYEIHFSNILSPDHCIQLSNGDKMAKNCDQGRFFMLLSTHQRFRDTEELSSGLH